MTDLIHDGGAKNIAISAVPSGNVLRRLMERLSCVGKRHLAAVCGLLLSLLMAGLARAQEPFILVQEYTAATGQWQHITYNPTPGVVLIDPLNDPKYSSPMPTLRFFEFDSPKDIDSIFWDWNVTYYDPNNPSKYITWIYGGGWVSPKDYLEYQTMAWPDIAGGSVTVTAEGFRCDGTKPENYLGTSFYILGNNQGQQLTDQQEVGEPWFFPNLVAQESLVNTTSGWIPGNQFFPSNATCAPSCVGYPTSNGSSSDVGVMQVSMQSWYGKLGQFGADNSKVYWNYGYNMQAGIGILAQAKSSGPTPPYTFWDNQKSQSVWTAVPATVFDTGTGQNTSTQFLCAGNQFAYAGGVNGEPSPPPTVILPASGPPWTNTSIGALGPWTFADAEWMTAYNGTINGYFISWAPQGHPNMWVVNYPYTSGGYTYDYVHKVCAQNPY